MYVHTYVCMYACMYACMYVCTYICTYVHTHVGTYIGMNVGIFYWHFVNKVIVFATCQTNERTEYLLWKVVAIAIAVFNRRWNSRLYEAHVYLVSTLGNIFKSCRDLYNPMHQLLQISPIVFHGLLQHQYTPSILSTKLKELGLDKSWWVVLNLVHVLWFVPTPIHHIYMYLINKA